MPLAAGTTLGPYEILSPLGAGGMGEVYRARDTRLDRFVAVKVLPEHLAADPELRERFEREARAVSSLNHPHICTLHDIGVQDGVSFLVMELLEGEPLADRLAKGRLPVNEALRYAVQIADALDKAHRHGVVHRDLKPGNVMVTKSGAKLLDFGLAKASRPAIVSSPNTGLGMTATPTLTAPLTQQGSILGTLQYMSPEQLEGREADARCDIFAFGAMVYEMVAGRRAFDGKSQVSILAAIVDHDPAPLSSAQPAAPPLLDHLVKTCLAKDPDERWQTMADVLIQLRLIGDPSLSATAAGVRGAETRRRAWIWRSAAGALTLLSAALLTALIIGRPQQPERRRVVFQLDAATSNSPLHIALSPDGTRLVWVTQTDKGAGLAMRALDQVNMQILSGTELPRTTVCWRGDRAARLAHKANSCGWIARERPPVPSAAPGPRTTILPYRPIVSASLLLNKKTTTAVTSGYSTSLAVRRRGSRSIAPTTTTLSGRRTETRSSSHPSAAAGV
jgi:eukaryotic-like serine/threonine-protein kinase